MTGIVDFRNLLIDENGDAINATNPLPTTGGGGGGGTALSDTVFVDSTGQLFVYRDTGSGTPSAFSVPSWTLYTPSGTISSASAGNAAASATGAAVPGSADYVGFNSGGNLVGVSSANPFPVTVGNFPATQNVNIVGGSSGNAAAGTTGAAVPSSADYVGYNSGGNLVGVSSATPLPVNVVAGSSGNAAASATGAAVPASADYIGVNVDGNLQGVSASNPMPVTAPTALLTAADRTENLIEMMARIVKLLESNAVVDSAQRQRITLDSITGALTLATVTTVGTVSTITAGTITTVNNLAANAGMDREQYINIARNTYATGIRTQLTFT